MSIHHSYAVFGLGRYGRSVAEELVSHGAEVLGVDVDEAIVNSAAAHIPLCKCADVTNPEVVRQLGIASVDVVVISMASNLEASVMAVMLCKELGVKTVIAKCANEINGKILLRVGADKVVFPERESGIRLAKNLVSAGFVDVIELSNDVSIVELDVKPAWVGKSLIELDLRKKYGLNVIAVREASALHINVDPSSPLEKDMKLVVIIHRAKLSKIK